MKNKLIYSICLSLLMGFTFMSCEIDGVLPVDIPEAISFNLEESPNIQVGESGASYDIEVQATTVSTSARTFNVVVDEAASTGVASEYSFSGSVTIPGGALIGSETISFNFGAMPIGPTRTLVFDLNGVPEEMVNNARTSHTVKYTAVCPLSGSQLTTVSFAFDPWPEELSWEIINDDNGLVVASGAEGSYAGLGSWTSDGICLVSGNYTFYVYDGYGDGGGNYEVSQGGNVIVSGGGAYGAGESQSFTISI